MSIYACDVRWLVRMNGKSKIKDQRNMVVHLQLYSIKLLIFCTFKSFCCFQQTSKVKMLRGLLIACRRTMFIGRNIRGNCYLSFYRRLNSLLLTQIPILLPSSSIILTETFHVYLLSLYNSPSTIHFYHQSACIDNNI